jgi:hypothetical protein
LQVFFERWCLAAGDRHEEVNTKLFLRTSSKRGFIRTRLISLMPMRRKTCALQVCRTVLVFSVNLLLPGLLWIRVSSADVALWRTPKRLIAPGFRKRSPDSPAYLRLMQNMWTASAGKI